MGAPQSVGKLKPGGAPLPIAPTPPFGSPDTFSGAVRTQAGDYDRIMAAYGDLIKNNQNAAANPANRPLDFKPITPQLSPFTQSADVTNSMSNLSGLAATGGYSQGDIGNIRARAIAPIRSIYSSAQQGLERSKALQGGYSPNMAAATSKMAREQSDIIGQKTGDIEAQIAQNVVGNKLAIAPTWSSASAGMNAARTASEGADADRVNTAAMFNQEMPLKYRDSNLNTNNFQNQNILGGIEGMRALYGTNPALVNTFGSQVAQAGQLGQGQQQINNAKKANLLNSGMRMFG